MDWKKVAIDTKVIVWNEYGESSSLETKAHFAGVNPMGFPEVYTNGKTSFTTEDKAQYSNIRLG